MKLYTEKEVFSQNQHFIFRLRNLYLNDNKKFNQFKDFITIPFYINDKTTFNYILFSDLFFSKGKEIDTLLTIGHNYLPEISDPTLLDLAKNKAKKFLLKDDKDAVCNYLQCISLNGKMTHFITNKCIIDENITINTSFFPDNMSSVSKMFANILPESKNSLVFWQRYQSLTKQEKIILKMIGNGVSNNDIGNQLFISKHTVSTHKKNIYRKLDINSLQELVKFSMVMDLL
ncbi:helix-turn-helix transcriptional regulator [Polaribacter sp. Hel_I_88]|uniref:helix-turn-helix domain-containing protein n=1 Tax=Polaribacter sp. Hel_I_88 TaxID=1250006 RepID=UPI00047BCD75|nr:helix-turn-helix transcriptional regulator [Polaribacter sp. Hel_I_88]